MMAEITFRDLAFKEEKDKIKAEYIKNYYFYIDKEELKKIAEYKIKEHSITFKCEEKRARKQFSQILEKGFAKLKNKVRDKDTRCAPTRTTPSCGCSTRSRSRCSGSSAGSSR